ncbi:hypothetical protein D3C75_1285680 [compost metagenome]
MIVLAEAVLDGHEGGLGQDLGAGPVAVGPEQQVAGAQAETGAVAQRIAHRDQLADHRV